MVDAQTRLSSVLGKTAGNLERAKGIRTVGQMLEFLPRTYLDPARPTQFAALPDGEYVVVLAVVRHVVSRQMRQRRGKMLVATVTDEQGGELDLTFFTSYGHETALLPGRRVICSGTVGSFGIGTARRIQLTHPDYQVIAEDGQGAAAGYAEGPIAVYSQVRGLTSMKIAAAMELVLHATADLPDPVPAAVRLRHGLPSLRESYRMVHQPLSEDEHRKGRWRLRWQEAFVLQAALAELRRSSRAVPAVPRVATPGGLAEQFGQRLPFALTAGQEEVLAEITDDLSGTSPMHRLLQGEVGSGKTVVALLAMLAVVDAGGQAALLAPTEVLAVQHHRSILRLLGPLGEGGLLGGAADGTRVALLTGSQNARERREMLLQAASGEAGIVVGTHALIQEHVQFADLGLVVVDEQHRFGVEQRDALRAKGTSAPHVLVMTATPIPRTVAMTVFGDMETSTLRELPQGRQPITTHVVPGDHDSWLQRTWLRVAEEVAAGGQVYVVCPRIGAEDDPDLPRGADLGPGAPLEPRPPADDPTASAASRVAADDDVEPWVWELEDDADAHLQGEPGTDTDPAARPPELHGVHQVVRALRHLTATAPLRLGLLHGRMTAEDKDAVMSDFAQGRLDVLVATTVIEVGVDVPNATAMVVLDADRFGISQLHQLRGRVGRGGKPGLCLLITQRGAAPAAERLAAVAATTDGFALARLDLELRREGDVLGSSQSGRQSGLRHLRLTRDEEIIVAAHEAAWQVVDDDPDLERHPALQAELARLDADRAAFLERG